MLSRQKIIFAILLAVPIFLLSGVVGSVAHAVEAAPTTQTTSQKEVPSNLTELEARSGSDSGDLSMIECAGWDRVGPSCWVPVGVYYVVYLPAVALLTMSGYIFDYTLSLSIDKVFIEQDFVNKAWTVVRDFSNMIFIFILLYTGIRTMFGEGNWGKTIINIVIIALIINFSMFFCKVIIDAGNILAVGVYEGMGDPKGPIDRPHKPEKKDNIPLVQERNISATLVNAFAPQQFMNLATLADSKSFATTIFIIAAIVSFYVAWIFIKASFMFVGRLIAFWFFMIISPFALISIVLPKGNIFDFWLYGLINQAFVAPVFLFFVYIIMMAVGTGGGILEGFGNPSGSGFFFDTIIIPVVVTGMITFALQYSLGIAKSMSGSFGDIGANIGNKMLGLGLGLATGGTAMVGRAVVGQGANKLLQTGFLQRQGTSESKFLKYTGLSALARGGVQLADETRKASFDVKGLGFVQKALKGEGIDAGKARKGGFIVDQKDLKKKADERAKLIELTDSEKEKIAKGYAVTKKTQGELKDKKDKAGVAHTKAQEAVAASATGQRVASATKNAEGKRSAAIGMSGDALVKKVEALKKREAAAITDEQKADIDKEIKQVYEDAKKAEQELEIAEKELEEATKVHEVTDEARAAASASKHLSEITTQFETASNLVDDAEKKFKEKDEKRREVSGKASTLLHFYYTRKDRNAVVQKIREGESKDEKAKKKRIETFKALMEESEKEGGEAKGGKKEEKEGGEAKGGKAK